MTVGAMHEQWLKMQAHVKDSTRAARASAWTAHVRDHWHDVTVADVQTSAVRAWVGDLHRPEKDGGSGAAAATIENALGVLRMVLALAVEDKRIPHNPCDGVKAPRREHSERAYLTHQQVDQLATAMDRDGLVVQFLAYTGLRYGEMAALKVSSFDMLRRRVNIRQSVTEVSGKLVWSSPKNHERRSVPFPKFLTEGLAARMEGKGRDDLVFTAPAGGVLRIATFRMRVFNKAVDKLRGLDKDGPADDRLAASHDARPPPHSGLSGHLGGGEREGRADHAWAQIGGADARYLCRSVPGRFGGGRGRFGRCCAGYP